MESTRHTLRDRLSERRESFDRRGFLRGAGACLALPFLESVAPVSAAPLKTLASTSSGAPLRTLYIYFPNGAIQSAWKPMGDGPGLELNETMKSLEPLKSKIQVLSGLDHQGGYPGPDGPGDHARASGGYLTGVRVKKTAGSDIKANVSIDQVAAKQVGHVTRFPSLELSCDVTRRSGNCDSGYSCAYQYNLSWSSPTTPIAPESNPRLVFERLFGEGSRSDRARNFQRRQAEERSLLDFVLDDARSLERDLAKNDRRKLDEYLTSVRDVERRIEQAESFGAVPDPAIDTPPGVPPSLRDHIGLMYDMLLIAFQTDSTRIATFLLAYDGANRTFPEIGVSEGHHYLTHHQNNNEMIEKVAKIDRFYVDQFARFLTKLDASKDFDGRSLLDNSMLLYGGGITDGNRHTHHDLPLILAGGGGGTLNPGRAVKCGGVPVSNLYLGMIDRLGITGVERFGDSTGRVTGI